MREYLRVSQGPEAYHADVDRGTTNLAHSRLVLRGKSWPVGSAISCSTSLVILGGLKSLMRLHTFLRISQMVPFPQS